jgi:hypothetical protein
MKRSRVKSWGKDLYSVLVELDFGFDLAWAEHSCIAGIAGVRLFANRVARLPKISRTGVCAFLIPEPCDLAYPGCLVVYAAPPTMTLKYKPKVICPANPIV